MRISKPVPALSTLHTMQLYYILTLTIAILGGNIVIGVASSNELTPIELQALAKVFTSDFVYFPKNDQLNKYLRIIIFCILL